MTHSGKQSLQDAKLVFWDFDGVIKDSVPVKGKAFHDLFLPFGEDIAQRVHEHHAAHGGMSRFKKIPLYLSWTDEQVTDQAVTQYVDDFAMQVQQAVIDSDWVPGAETFLQINPYKQMFILVSATPEDELRVITNALGITACFAEIHGAPKSKQEVIGRVLQQRNVDKSHALMIGDAPVDLEASEVNSVTFLLRRGDHNRTLFTEYSGPVVEDFHGI